MVAGTPAVPSNRAEEWIKKTKKEYTVDLKKLLTRGRIAFTHTSVGWNLVHGSTQRDEKAGITIPPETKLRGLGRQLPTKDSDSPFIVSSRCWKMAAQPET